VNHEQRRNQRIADGAEIHLERRRKAIGRLEKKIERIEEFRRKHAAIIEACLKSAREPSKNRVAWEKGRAENVEELREKLEAEEALVKRTRQLIASLDDFHPVQRHLEELPDNFRVASSGEWCIPNSRFKTFQDVYTPREAKILPRDAKGASRQFYDGLPLDPCPVDPERISDALAEGLGLGELEGLSEIEKLHEKDKMIPGLKKIFSHARPISASGFSSSHRVMVIADYYEEQDGKLIVTHRPGGKGVDRDQKTAHVYNSIYDAHRRTIHADSGYEAEREKVHGIIARIRQIQSELRNKKKDDPELDDVKKRITGEAEILSHVINQFKSEARDILVDVTPLTDSLGRFNPGATCARLLKAARNMEGRLPEIFDKSKYIWEDKRALGSKVDQSRQIMHQSLLAYRRLCEELQGQRFGFAAQSLSQMPPLDGLNERPFNLYAAKLTEAKFAIKDGLEATDGDFVREQSVNAYVICKIFEVQHERERILKDIAASPMETTIESLLGRARRLNEVVQAREVFPQIRTSYAQVYSELEKKIADLVRGLEHYGKEDLSEPEKLAMYGRLKQYLEDIDFAEILENLK